MLIVGVLVIWFFIAKSNKEITKSNARVDAAFERLDEEIDGVNRLSQKLSTQVDSQGNTISQQLADLESGEANRRLKEAELQAKLSANRKRRGSS